MAIASLRASARSQYPFTQTEAEHAAHTWFIPRTPGMSLAEWRDHFLSLHLASTGCDWRERLERTAVWNVAFNAGVAEVIAGGLSHE